MQIIDQKYTAILKKILENGQVSKDKRLFHKIQPDYEVYTKAISGETIRINLLEDGFPLISVRQISIKIFVAETIWFLLGDNTTDRFLKKYTNIWEDFKEDGNSVTSYGHRWRRYFGRDQIAGALEMLKEDSSSRHGIVITWDPADDSLANGTKKLNVPCQIGFMLNIIGGRLNLHSFWRSNDMVLGFPYDIAGNALLAHIFAAYLQVEVGELIYYIANAHIYHQHYDIAEKMAERNTNQKPIALKASNNWYERASNGDTSLVKEIIDNLTCQYTDFGKPIKGIKKII